MLLIRAGMVALVNDQWQFVVSVNIDEHFSPVPASGMKKLTGTW